MQPTFSLFILGIAAAISVCSANSINTTDSSASQSSSGSGSGSGSGSDIESIVDTRTRIPSPPNAFPSSSNAPAASSSSSPFNPRLLPLILGVICGIVVVVAVVACLVWRNRHSMSDNNDADDDGERDDDHDQERNDFAFQQTKPAPSAAHAASHNSRRGVGSYHYSTSSLPPPLVTSPVETSRDQKTAMVMRSREANASEDRVPAPTSPVETSRDRVAAGRSSHKLITISSIRQSLQLHMQDDCDSLYNSFLSMDDRSLCSFSAQPKNQNNQRTGATTTRAPPPPLPLPPRVHQFSTSRETRSLSNASYEI